MGRCCGLESVSCRSVLVLEKTRKARDGGRGKLLMGRENGAGEHNRLESLLRRTRYCLDKADRCFDQQRSFRGLRVP